MRLSALERKVLNSIQEDIPFGPAPFKVLSKRLGIKERALLESIKRLKEKGVIRRFAASLDHRRLGFKSSLIASKVPLNKLNSVVKKVVSYCEVTHCYLRRGEYNLWTVFISPEEKKRRRFIDKLAKLVGRENILNLPTKRQYKLKTMLEI